MGRAGVLQLENGDGLKMAVYLTVFRQIFGVGQSQIPINKIIAIALSA